MQCAVVILNFNGQHYLEQFLPSVIKYSVNHADVIVIDNASTDRSVIFLHTQYPKVRCLVLDQNYGFAGGYNQGLAKLNYPYYVLLNSDVELTDGWLTPLLSNIKNDKNIASIQPKMLAYDNKNYFEHAGAAGGFVDKLGYPFCRGRMLNITEQDSGQYNTNETVFWTSGACMLVRKEAFDLAGGFDVDFFAHMEEIDLCWRMQSLGYTCEFNYESTVFHVGGGTLAVGSPFKVFLNFRNNLYMLVKNLPFIKLLWLLPFRLVLDIVASIKFLIEGNLSLSWTVLKAHLSFYANLPKTLAKRKKVKRERNNYRLYSKSLVFQFYLLGKKKFSEL